MKQKFDVPVVFRVKAETLDEAKEMVDRLMRHGFEVISEHERPTWKAITRWMFGAIRGRKI